MARERKKSATQQVADAALAKKADAKREQEERRKNKRDPREKRARGDDDTMCILLKAPQSAMSR